MRHVRRCRCWASGWRQKGSAWGSRTIGVWRCTSCRCPSWRPPPPPAARAACAAAAPRPPGRLQELERRETQGSVCTGCARGVGVAIMGASPRARVPAAANPSANARRGAPHRTQCCAPCSSRIASRLGNIPATSPTTQLTQQHHSLHLAQTRQPPITFHHNTPSTACGEIMCSVCWLAPEWMHPTPCAHLLQLPRRRSLCPRWPRR